MILLATGTCPPSWKEALVVSIYNGKGQPIFDLEYADATLLMALTTPQLRNILRLIEAEARESGGVDPYNNIYLSIYLYMYIRIPLMVPILTPPLPPAAPGSHPKATHLGWYKGGSRI